MSDDADPSTRRRATGEAEAYSAAEDHGEGAEVPYVDKGPVSRFSCDSQTAIVVPVLIFEANTLLGIQLLLCL